MDGWMEFVKELGGRGIMAIGIDCDVGKEILVSDEYWNG